MAKILFDKLLGAYLCHCHYADTVTYINGDGSLSDVQTKLQTIESEIPVPGGNDGYIQYNSSGTTFAGADLLKWDYVNFSLKIGDATVLVDNPLAVSTNVNSYGQVNLQNKSSGDEASMDLVITADDGSDEANYIDMGLGNSGWVSAGDYDLYSAHDGYLIMHDGNLFVGTLTEHDVKFHTGGANPENLRATINPSGIDLPIGEKYMINGVDITTSATIADGQYNDVTVASGGTYWSINEVSTGSHGLVPVLPAETNKFFKSDGSWDYPSAITTSSTLVNLSGTELIDRADDFSLSYSGGKLFSKFTTIGSQFFYYNNNGNLVTISGVGLYKTKNFIYSSGLLVSGTY